MTTHEKAPRPELIGTISINSKGVGYVTIPERPDNDIIVPPERLGNALHGDTVAVRLGPKDFRDRDQGQVVRVETRAREEFVGTLQVEGEIWYLAPDLRRIHVRFHVPTDKLAGGKAHDKVLVRLLHWLPSDNMPEGEVIEVLGPAGDNNVEMKAILRSQGLADHFPPEVEAEAAALPDEISVEEIARRRDFREILTFTIDPDTAQDFDDALSFMRLPNGNVEIGIHIADVSHFVREGTALDREAQKRATSIYLVDRVIPMLPERLSNSLASLEADKDRLTFSCVVTLTPEAETVDYWLGRGVIHSNKRFTYEEAQEVLDRKEGLYYEELNYMNELAKKLSAKKFAAGAIAFESDEIKFKLDDQGRPLFVYKKERGDTHKMIEDYMLLANRVVAEHVFNYKENGEDNVFVYRIHDYPKIEKMTALQGLVRQFGYKLDLKDGQVESTQLSRLLERIENTREEQLIETTVMRSMAKAIYSTKNIGHYGLAFEYYTHFTSPIRRYPDVMVHRLLSTYLDGKVPVGDKVRERLESLCTHCSGMERRAMEAEWDSIKLKQVEYMTERIGKVFSGKISGVTAYGLYLQEEESAAEGMLRVRDMVDDYYEYDEKNLRFVGKKGKVYQLGDKVQLRVKTADLETRTISYEIVDKEA